MTTDYLLKDELEEEEFTDNDSHVRQVTMSEAKEYIEWRKSASVRIAAATFLCIFSPIPLLFFGMSTEVWGKLSEGAAGAAGLGILLVLVAVAVGIYIFCGYQNAPYRFLEEEPFDTEYGVRGMIKEKQKAFQKTYTIWNIIGIGFCILSPIPAILSAAGDMEVFLATVLIAITMLLAAIGVVFFILGGVRAASFQRLLKEGEFTDKEKRKSKVKEAVGRSYWLLATAVYLGWSFATDNWGMTWILWPVAGVLFALVITICNMLLDKAEA